MNDTPAGKNILHVGIDVSKARLDVHCPAWDHPAASFANTPAGLGKLMDALPAGRVHLLCEATGGYEKALLAAAWKRGIDITSLNPARVRDYARATGIQAKTDGLDASVIARFGEATDPAPMRPPSATQEALTATVRRRDTLAGERARHKNALEKETDAYLLRDIRTTVTFLARRIAQLDARISKLIASDPDLAGKRERMERVKGIGPVASAVVLAEGRELGSLSDKEAASLAGLAPFNRDSGQKRGVRSIRGGRSRLRRGLYMPALSASRHNPILKALYERLTTKGKAHHVAIAAVMRKLVCLLNRILADPCFEPA